MTPKAEQVTVPHGKIRIRRGGRYLVLRSMSSIGSLLENHPIRLLIQRFLEVTTQSSLYVQQDIRLHSGSYIQVLAKCMYLSAWRGTWTQMTGLCKPYAHQASTRASGDFTLSPRPWHAAGQTYCGNSPAAPMPSPATAIEAC